MPIAKILISDIIKFFLATSIILLGFLWKGEKVGETEETFYFQDYMSQQTFDEIENNQEIHESAPDIENKCTQKDPLCEKIDPATSQETIPYTNQIHTVAYFINDNQMVDKKIIDTIQKIELKNNEGGKRGYATRDTIVLNIGIVNSLKEFQDLSSHELGHIFDLGVTQGTSTTKNKSFTEFNRPVFASNDPSLYFYKISRTSETIRKKETVKKDFCSGYGMTNPFEDFAECFNLYINHQNFFKIIAKGNSLLTKKYNFIATLLQGASLEKNTKDLELLKESKSRRPWDTTKL